VCKVLRVIRQVARWQKGVVPRATASGVGNDDLKPYQSDGRKPYHPLAGAAGRF